MKPDPAPASLPVPVSESETANSNSPATTHVREEKSGDQSDHVADASTPPRKETKKSRKLSDESASASAATPGGAVAGVGNSPGGKSPASRPANAVPALDQMDEASRKEHLERVRRWREGQEERDRRRRTAEEEQRMRDMQEMQERDDQLRLQRQEELRRREEERRRSAQEAEEIRRARAEERERVLRESHAYKYLREKPRFETIEERYRREVLDAERQREAEILQSIHEIYKPTDLVAELKAHEEKVKQLRAEAHQVRARAREEVSPIKSGSGAIPPPTTYAASPGYVSKVRDSVVEEDRQSRERLKRIKEEHLAQKKKMLEYAAHLRDRVKLVVSDEKRREIEERIEREQMDPKTRLSTEKRKKGTQQVRRPTTHPGHEASTTDPAYSSPNKDNSAGRSRAAIHKSPPVLRPLFCDRLERRIQYEQETRVKELAAKKAAVDFLHVLVNENLEKKRRNLSKSSSPGHSYSYTVSPSSHSNGNGNMNASSSSNGGLMDSPTKSPDPAVDDRREKIVGLRKEARRNEKNIKSKEFVANASNQDEEKDRLFLEQLRRKATLLVELQET
eukprot:ANDGO_02069.mRNA.1 hypothetical protein